MPRIYKKINEYAVSCSNLQCVHVTQPLYVAVFHFVKVISRETLRKYVGGRSNIFIFSHYIPDDDLMSTSTSHSNKTSLNADVSDHDPNISMVDDSGDLVNQMKFKRKKRMPNSIKNC